MSNQIVISTGLAQAKLNKLSEGTLIYVRDGVK
jgi:hypothetical protein